MSSPSQVAPFVAPFAVFMLFLASADSFWPDQHYVLYPLKALLVAAVIAFYWRQLPSLKPASPLFGIAVGIVGVILWVGLDPWSTRLDHLIEEMFPRVAGLAGLGSAPAPNDLALVGRNPFQLYPPAEAWTLFAFRLAGIALVVPVMEELFWRGFLMRWLIREDFGSVPLGTYQPFSFWVTTVCFAAEHGAEWPLGLVAGAWFGAWFVRTKSLGSVMLAHGVTNFLLALYCLFSGDWHFLSTAPAVPLPK